MSGASWGTKVEAIAFNASPKLKAVCQYAAGVNNIDRDEALIRNPASTALRAVKYYIRGKPAQIASAIGTSQKRQL